MGIHTHVASPPEFLDFELLLEDHFSGINFVLPIHSGSEWQGALRESS